ncbi:hypothetical protein [Sporolactobacillus terrae]|uniref:hypothetical protein n=1 Tax=Sporolactobacillus terrae TaxID=269673 RepID=UPI001119F9E2|nr:hypothetical protein [Sporolactobacillus terrae]
MNEVPIIDHETFILDKERLKKSGEWSGKAGKWMGKILDLFGKKIDFTLITSDGREIVVNHIFAVAFGIVEEIIKNGSFNFPIELDCPAILDVILFDPELNKKISLVEELKNELF